MHIEIRIKKLYRERNMAFDAEIDVIIKTAFGEVYSQRRKVDYITILHNTLKRYLACSQQNFRI